jgi:S1-C subfamily serine protease
MVQRQGATKRNHLTNGWSGTLTTFAPLSRSVRPHPQPPPCSLTTSRRSVPRVLSDGHALCAWPCHRCWGNGQPVLERGDIIVEFNGRKIEEMNDLPHVVASTPPNTDVPMKILRKGQDLTPEIARSFRVSETKGLVVTNVDEGTPADEAGMRRGDVIVEVNQKKVENLHDYRAALARVGSADSLQLLMRRGGNVLYVALKMAK